jgi:DeoR family transcriptional regulator of aga operon
MTDSNKNLSEIERQQDIFTWVNQERRLTVAQICQRFAISEATARRDLEDLAAKNKVQRFHGGILALTTAPPELPILQRELDEPQAKRRIGLAAASLVKDGETIFISSGTTTLEAARALRQRHGLTILSNSLPVLSMFSNTNNTVIAMGGIFRSSEQSYIGHITEKGLAEVRADKVFIGIRAMDIEHGLTNDYLPEAMTDRAILRIGLQVIVLADHTKCGRVSTSVVAPLSSIHMLITDDQTPTEFVEALQATHIVVKLT